MFKQAQPAQSASGEAPTRGAIRRHNEARILAAAERVFAEAGFAGATMAAIAAAAPLPKANVHYYFKTKEAVYRAVLAGILELWLEAAEAIRPASDPAEALAAYVRAKMRFSRTRPHASKIFANELLHGAPHLAGYLAVDLRRRVERKAAVIERWIAEGRMASVDAKHLFFMLWAMTQTYADFDVQVRAVLGVDVLSDAAFAAATETVVRFALRGCGVEPPAPP